MCYISRKRGAVNAGCRGKSSPGEGFPLAGGLFRGVETFPEESPDCKERGVLLKRRIPRTISRGKTSATESIPPPEAAVGNGGSFPVVRVKWRGKSPPGAGESRAVDANSSRSKTK